LATQVCELSAKQWGNINVSSCTRRTLKHTEITDPGISRQCEDQIVRWNVKRTCSCSVWTSRLCKIPGKPLLS